VAKRHRTAARDRERRKLQDRIIPTSCPRCHAEAADQTHEVINRSQYSAGAADLDVMVQLGPVCHAWVTGHPDEARAEGWHLRSWEHDETAMSEAQAARLDQEWRGRPS
jgi:hypothetical protein